MLRNLFSDMFRPKNSLNEYFFRNSDSLLRLKIYIKRNLKPKFLFADVTMPMNKKMKDLTTGAMNAYDLCYCSKDWKEPLEVKSTEFILN